MSQILTVFWLLFSYVMFFIGPSIIFFKVAANDPDLTKLGWIFGGIIWLLMPCLCLCCNQLYKEFSKSSNRIIKQEIATQKFESRNSTVKEEKRKEITIIEILNNDPDLKAEAMKNLNCTNDDELIKKLSSFDNNTT